MKTKMIIAAALCAIGFVANAQTEKGRSMIGGSISYSSDNSIQGTSRSYRKSFSVAPNYAHFISNNLAIGLGVMYVHGKNENTYESIEVYNGSYVTNVQTSDSREQTFNFYPFLRYYLNITDTFKFFGELNAGLGFGNLKETDVNNNVTKNTIKRYNASLTPGLAIFPNKKLAIELGFKLIGYSKSTFDRDQNSPLQNHKMENFSFGTDTFSPTLGIKFHL